jgi:hypothetical protein
MPHVCHLEKLPPPRLPRLCSSAKAASRHNLLIVSLARRGSLLQCRSELSLRFERRLLHCVGCVSGRLDVARFGNCLPTDSHPICLLTIPRD